MGNSTDNNSTSVDDQTQAMDTSQGSSYAMTGNLMVAAIVLLSLVILLIALLHVYARMFWGRSSAHGGRRPAFWRSRNRRVDMNAQEPYRVVAITGLEKAIIDALPTFSYNALPSRANVLECAVCLSEFQEGEKGRLLPNCNHSFHTECIDMWFESHSTCPLCRTSAGPEPAAAMATIGENEDSSTGISFVVFEPESLRDSEPTVQLDSSEQVDLEEASTGATPAPQTREDDSCEEFLPSPGGRRNSERSPQNQGIQFPTNVLFWGNQTHVSSRVSSPRSELLQPGPRSLPHIVIEIPRRAENFFSPRRLSFSSPRYSSAEEQTYTSPNGQPLKSPVGRLTKFKRMVSKDTKAFPSEHENGGECGQAGANSSA